MNVEVLAGVGGRYGMVFLPFPHKYTDNIIRDAPDTVFAGYPAGRITG
jgi:hypothetical protein